MDKKKCMIVPGCPDIDEDPEDNIHWFYRLRKELLDRDIDAEVADMPSPQRPDYGKFREEFNRYEVDENTVLVGHSCGASFLVRRLGETKKKISKLILVAPWKVNDEGDDYREEFYTYDIDETISERVRKIVMFTSDDEDSDGKKSLEIFYEALGGEVMQLKGCGHYVKEDMGTEEFPELLEKILE